MNIAVAMVNVVVKRKLDDTSERTTSLLPGPSCWRYRAVRACFPLCLKSALLGNLWASCVSATVEGHPGQFWWAVGEPGVLRWKAGEEPGPSDANCDDEPPNCILPPGVVEPIRLAEAGLFMPKRLSKLRRRLPAMNTELCVIGSLTCMLRSWRHWP
jgi:hypothetical protein